MPAGTRYVTAPTVTSVTPPSGRQSGNTSVTIAGTGFRPGASVAFGGTAMSSYSVVDHQTITGYTPAHAAGAVNVVVTNADGQSGTLPNGYTYIPPPTVTSVIPGAGPLTGGTAVTITGTGFYTGATATIGCAAATSVVVVNATTMTAVTPACSAGHVTVTVTNADGGYGSRYPAFTFGTAPRIDSILPNAGSTSGGTAVTLTGVNFQAGATVTIGVPATNVNVVSGTSVTVTTAAHAAAFVSVVLTNPDTQTYTYTYLFTYQPPPVFTDDPLQPRTTPVKLVHLTQQRQAIATLRARYGLPVYTWTDPSPVARTTVIKQLHLAEMRIALSDVYALMGRSQPTYTNWPTPRSSVVAATDIAELRAAILAIW